MKITEVRIFPTESKDGKLKAFATMTFDDWFVIRNVKIIQGNNGLFVAMPSRKAMESCSKCSFKNAVGSRYCNQCGIELSVTDSGPDKQANHMDIAHPITQECRVYIQDEILKSYGEQCGNQDVGELSEDALDIATDRVSLNASFETLDKGTVDSDLEEEDTSEQVVVEDAKDIAL
ncbi:MAG: SpoVG family protein [Candidatus Omnitrophota bacterium]